MDRQQAHRILKELRLKVTPKRLEVMTCLADEPSFLSADQVWNRLKSRLPQIGLPTVYRILDELSESGIVSRIFMSDRKQYYFLCSNPDHHHHFVCEACRHVEDVELCGLDTVARDLSARSGARVTSHILQINGICASCSRTVEGKSKKSRLRNEKRRFPKLFLCLLCFCLLFSATQGCTRSGESNSHNLPGTKLHIVTTLFPLYDLARTIAGARGEVSLLLPPGTEPHSFNPRPDDIVRLGKASLFIYTNPAMEPWAEKIIQGIDNKNLRVIEAGTGVKYLKAGAKSDHDHDGDSHGGAEGVDPHIWLDFANAVTMVDTILVGFVAADPVNREYYEKNASTLKAGLIDLDRRYREGLATCQTKTFLHGGHFTFGYLAHRYGLSYLSLSGVSSEAEPSAAAMASMVRRIRQSGVRYLFAEELLSPRITEILAAEAGVGILKLHGAHNLSREDFQRGVTFISLMNDNLLHLQKGLACRVK